MIVIKRGKEPNSLLQFRKQNPNADYESDTPSDVLKDVREQMWREQKHLCAYCMKKIDSPDLVRIEHCRPRHPHNEVEHDKKATLDFKWMLGVCYGNSLVKGVKMEDETCDAHRGNTELTINGLDMMRSMDSGAYDEYQRISRESSNSDRQLNTLKYLTNWYSNAVTKNPHMVEKYEAKSDEYIEKNVKNQKVDSTFSDLKTESKSAFIESLKAFQAQNPNFLSNIVNKELSRKYWAYGIIA